MGCANVHTKGKSVVRPSDAGGAQKKCRHRVLGQFILLVRRFDSQLAGALEMPLKRSDELRSIDPFFGIDIFRKQNAGASIFIEVRDVAYRCLEVWQFGASGSQGSAGGRR
jgi:hypothetical protein